MPAKLKEPVKIPTPRVLLPIGDPERDRGTVYFIKRTWEHTLCTIADWKKALDGLENEKVWERYPIENPYGSLDALLMAEIGLSTKDSIEEAHRRTIVIAEKTNALPELKAVGAPEGNHNAAKTEDENKGYTRNNCLDRGNSSEYRARKLKRDHPDVFQRMLDGEFASVTQAEEAAGIKKNKDRWNAPQDILKLAIAIQKRFLPQQISQLKELLP